LKRKFSNINKKGKREKLFKKKYGEFTLEISNISETFYELHQEKMFSETYAEKKLQRILAARM